MYKSTITKGIDLYVFPLEKFHTVTITFLLRTPLKRDTVTANVLVAASLLKGCSKYSTPRAVELHLENINSTASAGVIKKGEEHIIELTVTSDPSFTEDAFEFAGNILSSPLFENTENAKALAKDNIDSLINNKRKYAFEKCIENMCHKEPYGINGDGCKEDIDKVSIPSHYRQLINNSKIEIMVAGNTAPYKINEYINKYISLPARNAFLHPCSYMYYPLKERYIKENMDIAQSKLCIGFRLNIDPSGDEWYKAAVANELFGGSAGSALFRQAREEESLCYYISSRLLSFKSILIAEAGIDIKNAEKTADIIKSALHNISEENIETAKADIINSYKALTDSPKGILDFYLNGIISGNISSIEETINKISQVTTIKDIFSNSLTDTVYVLGGRL